MGEEERREEDTASPFARLEYEEWLRHQNPHLGVEKSDVVVKLLLLLAGVGALLLALYLVFFI